AALLVGGKAADLKKGVTLARQAIESGAATEKLEAFASLSQQLS
ncbi:MAG: anthranilate phosphoribosyltransferase, partial [Chloroflexi bacterium]|nr:anthranilate phosphoribosyltransferase [Chloroflexota bacterium]